MIYELRSPGPDRYTFLLETAPARWPRGVRRVLGHIIHPPDVAYIACCLLQAEVDEDLGIVEEVVDPDVITAHCGPELVSLLRSIRIGSLDERNALELILKHPWKGFRPENFLTIRHRRMRRHPSMDLTAAGIRAADKLTLA